MADRWGFVVALALLGAVGRAGGNYIRHGSTFNLRILHNNDMHSRFDETDIMSEPCTEELARRNECYGGFARTSYLIKKFRADAQQPGARPLLYLNAGDTFTGTVWFTMFKDAISAELMNALSPNASTFGNHEFDFGERTLARYVNASQYPIVASNLDLRNAQYLPKTSGLYESFILDVNGTSVGLVGYVTPLTMNQSSTGSVFIKDEIESVNALTTLLRQQGVDIIIALGHSGFAVDKEVAASCPDLDIVIGGHTNTFLYRGQPPNVEVPEDLYPVVVEKANGKRTLVVQAYAYTKYLGVLDVSFDVYGDLVQWDGNPVLIGPAVPKDPEVEELLEKYRPNITALSEAVGSTNFVISGDRRECRSGECTAGNLVTNAILRAAQSILHDRNASLDTFVALTTAGGIRASIPAGIITRNHLKAAFPFDNLLYRTTIRGDVLLAALEHSASMYKLEEDGGFLQFVGLKVTYDFSREVGDRVVAAEIQIAEDCSDSERSCVEDVDSTKAYKVVMCKFLLKGGDGYDWGLGDEFLQKSDNLETFDGNAILRYTQQNSPLSVIAEGRQIVLNKY